MTEAQPPDRPSVSDVAAEPPEQSVAQERDVVGEAPDEGDTVPTDDAQ